MTLSHLFSFLPGRMLATFTGAFGLFAGIFGIGFLIGFHELGHFLFAKFFGVKTPVFSIGFGPLLVDKKIGDTHFTLRAIPLGGYVQMAGTDDVQKESDHELFSSKPFYQKFLIMLGGILFNLMFAYAAISFVFGLGLPESRYGYPYNASTAIAELAPDKPLSNILKPGDKIITFDGTSVGTNGYELLQKIESSPDKQVALSIERDGKVMNLTVTIPSIVTTPKRDAFRIPIINITIPERAEQKTGTLYGILKQEAQKSAGLIGAIKNGFAFTNRIIYITFKAFKQLITTASVKGLQGPISVISETGKGANQGVKSFLLLLAFISINLAILNLIPLPILDGGQILLYGIEAVIGRSLPDRVREIIFIGTWVSFIALALYLSYHDIYRIVMSFLGKS